MNDKERRAKLVEKITRLGLPPGPHRASDPYPVVSLEDLFEGNNDPGSIACNLWVSYRLGVAGWYQILKLIRHRPDVQDVMVEIFESPDDDTWPASDRIYIITSASEDDVESWVEALHPDEIAEGYIDEVPSGAPLLQPGMKVGLCDVVGLRNRRRFHSRTWCACSARRASSRSTCRQLTTPPPRSRCADSEH
jgi:hypothetical protein